MTINYKIGEDALLTHQLYVASKSERIKKKRQKSRITIPILYFILGLLLSWNNKLLPAFGLVIFGILWFFIYPIWEKKHYINHYRGFINENFKERLGRLVTLEFNSEYILAKDNGSESKILTTELEEICEIPTIILVKLSGGRAFILPKDKISDINDVIQNLKEFAESLQVKYNVEEKWKWK